MLHRDAARELHHDMTERMRSGSVGPGAGTGGTRAPRQERGRRRVDEILDAAEALVHETGPAACSIQEIARQAGASVGSIYHFFPTKEAIFDALRARHASEVRALAAAMLAHSEEWDRLDLPTFVERVISPFAEFLGRAPAYVALATSGTGQRLTSDAVAEAELREALLAALARRASGSTPAERHLRVDVVMAIVEGISSRMAHAGPPARRRLVAELERAVGGYLATYEEERRGLVS